MATPVKYAMQNEGRTTLEVVLLIAVVVLGICLFLARNPDIIRPRKLSATVCASPLAPSDTAQLRACLNGLTFDTRTAAGDEQRLMVRDAAAGLPACHGDPSHGCRHGPLAKIEPVIGAQERDTSALNQGAIIARLFLRAGETEAYPKLNLVPVDTTYWWVQRQSDTTAISRYLRISEGQVIDTLVGTITIEQHPDSFSMALARFIWDDADEKTQGACTPAGCCR